MRFVPQVIKQRLYHNHVLLPLSDDIVSQIIFQCQVINLIDCCLNFKKRGKFILCKVFSQVNST